MRPISLWAVVFVAATVLGRAYGDLNVSPADDFVSIGGQGGPFVPASRVYTLTNVGLSALDWTTSKAATWLDLTPSSGTLAPATSETVTVALNSNADVLGVGDHVTSVTYANTTSGTLQSHNVKLRIAPGPVVDLDFPGGVLPFTQVFGDDANDMLGSAVYIVNGIAFGDINGDGFDDMIVGVPNGDPGGRNRAGEVYVIYGGATLPTSLVDLNTDGSISASSETRILGDDGGDLAGWAVASGDFNDDGYDDVIIGARGADGSTGEVYVVYGAADLPGTLVDLNTNGAIGATSETRILGDDSGDLVGHSVACGDVNGDGFDDVIVGAPDADPPGANRAGEVYVVYGSAGLRGTIVDLESTGTIMSVAGETRIFGDDFFDFAGSSVASGDVNGDGYDDVFIGVPNMSLPGRGYAGGVYVVYGGAALAGSIVDLDTDDAISTAGETRVFGDDSWDQAGLAVAGGDVNGDGYDDVIIGAYEGAPFGRTGAGEAYVIYGGPSVPASIIDLNTNGAVSTAGETRIFGGNAGAEMAYSVASSDVNGDGYADVVLGAPYADPDGRNEAGEVQVIYGGENLSSSSVDLASVWGDLRVIGENTTDSLGFSSGGGGDLDQDGFAEFAAAAIGGDNPSIGGQNNSGMAVTVFGDGPATSATVTEYFKAGDAPRRGFGGRLSPVMRTWLSFDGGTTAPTTTRLVRSDAGISNLGNISLLEVADVVWEITTARTGYSSAEVTFQYLDSEIRGLDETELSLFQAPALSGPWTLLTTQSLDLTRNTVTATVTDFSFFALVTDQTPPEVTVDQSAGQADPTNSLPISFDVVFTEDVFGFEAIDVTMGGTATGATYDVTGSGSTFTITVTAVSGDGTLEPTLAAGVCQDAVGNPNNASTSTDNSVSLDRQAPTVSMASAQPDPTNASPISVTVSFSESVTGFDVSDITASNAGVNNFSGSGADYGFDLVPTGQGLVTADIGAGAAQDAAGNSNTAAPQFARTYDSVSPAVTVNQAAAQDDPTSLTPVVFDVSFSEPVSGFDASDVAMGGTATGVAFNVTGSGAGYAINVTIVAGDGTLKPTLAAGVCQDAVGNPNNASTSTDNSVSLDRQAPTVSMASAQPDPTNASPISVTVSFSESVTGFDVSDITASNAGVNNFSGSGADYGFDLVPTGQGLVTADIGAGAAQDAAGNSNTAAPQFARTYDSVSPAVTVNQAAAQDDPTSLTPVVFDVSFSEPVSGFDASDVAMGGTATGVAFNVTGSGAGYAINVTIVAGDGTLVPTIGAGAAQDAAGNLSAASSSTDNSVEIDQTNPVALSVLRSGASPTSATSVAFAVTFSEAVAGVDTSDFDIVTTGLVGAAITSVVGGPTVYSVNVATGLGEGEVRLDVIDDDSIVDHVGLHLGGAAAGNGNRTSDETYIVDNRMPAVVSVLRGGPSPTNATTVSWTVTFSEAVSSVDLSDFDLTTTGPTGAIVTSVSGGPTAYTVVAGTGAGDGDIRLNVIDDDSIVDGLGNPLDGAGRSVYTSGEIYVIDKTSPALSGISLRDDDGANSPSTNFTNNQTVDVFLFSAGADATEMWLSESPTFTDGGWAAFDNPTSYTFATSVEEEKAVYVLLRDALDNRTGAAGDVNTTITLDTTAPGVSSAAVTPDPDSPLVDVTFDEPVGFGVLAAGNYLVTNLSTSGLITVLAVTDLGSGTYRLETENQVVGDPHSVSVSNVADRAGNLIDPASNTSLWTGVPVEISRFDLD